MTTTCKKPEYYGSPRITAEVADCSMPLTFDQYSKCSFRCLYCFSEYSKGVGASKEGYFGGKVTPVNIDSVYKLFATDAPHMYRDFVRSRTVLQWGGLADPFCNFERKFGVGLEILRLFNALEYPVCFSTKGVWWLDDDRYAGLFRGSKFFNTKVSIITGDAAKAKVVEKGVPSPQERLKAIEKIAKLDAGGATLRLRPYILGISDGTYKQVIRDAANAGAEALSMEFFCLETRSRSARKNYQTMSQVAELDLFKFYRRYSRGSGYLRLNRNVKREIVDEAERVCREAGMRFYISDAHFKERCDNGSCCGLSEEWNYSRGQFTEALVLCRKNGEVTWGEIGPNIIAVAKNRCSVLNMPSKRWKFNGRNFLEYLHFLWNTPDEPNSPYRYFEGVMKPDRVDENGDVVYTYDPTRA